MYLCILRVCGRFHKRVTNALMFRDVELYESRNGFVESFNLSISLLVDRCGGEVLIS